MKIISQKLFHMLILIISCVLISSCTKTIVDPVSPPPTQVTVNPHDTMVKFTLYSKRVPYIWKRVVNTVWVQDTIKTNDAIRYENYDVRNLGIGYWATMNLAGINTDSMHIKAEYKGKTTQMSSLPHLSAAYVLLDNVKP